jgi:hypothetical protein
MADTSSLENYPDILGHITGGMRANINVLQVATALRPRVAMAGKPLEMLMLMQNACDVLLEVMVTLNLPTEDAKRQKGRFRTKADRLLIKLDPGAVGLVTLPLSSLPDTAPSADYKIGMEMKITPAGAEKPNRVRSPQGGGEVAVTALDDAIQGHMETLKKAVWTATVSGNKLTSNLTIMSGKVGSFADLEPSWLPLWSLTDGNDDMPLLKQYATVMMGVLLPALKRPAIYPVMKEYTDKYFIGRGYTLLEQELEAIARYVTMILEQAAPSEKDLLFTADSSLNVRRYFDKDGKLIPSKEGIALPRWCKEVLKVFGQDARTQQFPIKAVGHFAYEALLYDAMNHAFEKIEAMTSTEVGTQEERDLYIRQIFVALQTKQLNFDALYMPLMIGAIASVDGVILKGEKSQDIVKTLRFFIDKRMKEITPDIQHTYDIATQILELVANKYSFSEY